MQIPAQITFHNLDPSPALKTRINEKITKLDEHFPNIMSCHVVIEAAHHHQHKGRLYSARINITLPGGEVVVSHHPGKNPKKHDKAFAAMNNAFAAIKKQLTRFKDIKKANIKSHQVHFQTGVVSNFFDEMGYGFLATVDGEEIYFHRNAVENNRFLELDIGKRVRYAVTPGEGRKGPQAITVRLMK